MRHFDLLIIGTGSGNSIIGPEHDDWDIAIAEDGVFGGTCLNRGCIPSKMLVVAADTAELARRGPRLGVHTRFEGADWPAIRDRIFGRIDPIAAGGEEYRRSLPHVTVYRDTARFVGPRRVVIGDEIVTADHIVVAVGARPHIPDVDGLAEVGYHTSDTIMRIDELPRRLIVIGAGYIAAELGHVFGSLGSEVVFVVRGETFLRNEDDDIRLRFTECYRHRFEVLCSTQPVAARREGDDIVLEVSVDGDHRGVRGDAVLVATGRIPNSDRVDATAGGLAVDHAGYVVVDEYQRTTVEGVWALGDVCNPVQLKHTANAEARVVAHNLTHPDELIAVDHRVVPHAVFGHPQVASVGLTERQALERGIAYRSHVQPYAAAAYGWALEDTEGFVKVIADARTRHLLGAHIIGPQASTLIQQLVQGMVFGQTVDEMARGQYYIHPALTEVVEQALLEL
ncbi:MAG: mycothione reductase [Actinomyces sp.]|nr:MAG: mycothione reductase [Actinomyces sp.]